LANQWSPTALELTKGFLKTFGIAVGYKVEDLRFT
jgi:hypothetical protein